MGKSKNDIGYGAGKLRVLVETARGTRATGGKKQYDKRHDIAKRDADRRMQQAMRK